MLWIKRIECNSVDTRKGQEPFGHKPLLLLSKSSNYCDWTLTLDLVQCLLDKCSYQVILFFSPHCYLSDLFVILNNDLQRGGRGKKTGVVVIGIKCYVSVHLGGQGFSASSARPLDLQLLLNGVDLFNDHRRN